MESGAATFDQPAPDALASHYGTSRARSLELVAPLSDADATIQSMPDASPAKWHLAHTPWFFETFVLRDHVPGYEAFNPAFGFLFNSYYEAEGPRHTRAARGMLARPALDEIHGKFMNGQHVLKGASCATPRGSSRASYRNFFYAPQRWQFTGLRLVRDL